MCLCFTLRFAFAVCGQCPAILTGESGGLKEGDKILLFSDNGYKDSVKVKNGIFKFTLPVESADLFFLKSRDEKRAIGFPVFLKPGSIIKLKADIRLKHITLSGDSLADEQNSFWQGMNPFSERIADIQKKISLTNDSSGLIQLNVALDSQINATGNYAKEWVKAHPSSCFSVAVIFLFITMPDAAISKIEDTTAERYFDQLNTEAKRNNFISGILMKQFALHNRKYEDNLSLYNFNRDDIRYLEDRKLPASVGSIAPALIFQDTTGNNVRLKDVRHKYLLIDFWASWCIPCRQNNPLLRSLNNRYRNKGLSVLSISIDNNKEQWKKAIMKDSMDWAQGIDNSEGHIRIRDAYSIQTIPFYFLVDAENRIIVKSAGDIYFIEEELKKLL